MPRIVGIGASAGGLEALEEFFRSLPSNSGMAYVVVQHLSPDYKSLMVELLSKYTDMKVLRAENGMEVEADHVYLITPRKNLFIRQSKLYLEDRTDDQGLNLPVDIFLRSLAEDQAELSVAIILSGTGSDGTLGIRAVKGAGGLVFSQDKQSAKFDGMPCSATATGMVDYILSPKKIAEELMRFINHPLVTDKAHSSDKASKKKYLSRILDVLKEHTGTDFSAYKEPTICRRIERRIGINRIDTIDDYASFLESNQKEAVTLYKELLIGVTRFFRDRDAFDTVSKKAIRLLFDKENKESKVRIWCPGCSTGEEAYSLAILLSQEMEKLNVNLDVKIFATDIDRESLEYAGAGTYPESIAADVESELLKKYFIKRKNSFEIQSKIRKMIVFAYHNVLKDPPFSAIDMVSCRNMLIYLKPEMQQRVLNAFHFSLRQSGFLFLGASESVGDLSTAFTTVDAKAKLYICREGARRAHLSDFFTSTPKKRVTPGKKYPEHLYRNSSTSTSMIDASYDILLTEFAPASVIINDNFDLLHICRESSPFIKIPIGKASLNLLDLVPSGIRAAVSTAVGKAIKSGEPVTYYDLLVPNEKQGNVIDLSVRPVPGDQGKATGNFLVLFLLQQKDVKRMVIDSESDERIGHQSHMIADLEQELQYTKENLQATIEELETSNEELQATNEELIASNEELQSTNEELQSVNEELYTVNAEYQNKIEELTQLNNDINNLLKNANIGMIFLDKDRRIRKYTQAATEAINIMDMDIGRPIGHLTGNIEYQQLENDISDVLDTLIPVEKEVMTKNGTWMLMRVLPYRTTNNVVDGIVMTFLNITERKNFETKLMDERNLLIRVLENSPVAKTMVDNNGAIVYANAKAEEIFNLSREEIYTLQYNDKFWNIRGLDGKPVPSDQLPYAVLRDSGKPLSGYRHYITIGESPPKKILLQISGSPIFGDNNEVQGAVFALEVLPHPGGVQV
jgi:two-component system, chemotaxis family, CheB/CheR fusion protein